MDCAKVGQLISRLRIEKGLTQKNIGDALGVSNKTVSKWECGMGCPDVSLWSDLSVILGVDIKQMMEGEIKVNRMDSGNVEKVRFYVCPTCHNALMSTGSAGVFCCGRKLEWLKNPQSQSIPEINVQPTDGEYYITIDHPMERENHILFAAYVKNDRVIFIRMYPEQEAAFRVSGPVGGRLYLYSTTMGLFVKDMK